MLFTRRTCATISVAVLVATPVSFAPIAAPAAGGAAPVNQAVADSQVVLDWERTSMRTIYTEAATPIPVGVLYLGFTSVAMYDAVKTAYRRQASPAAAAAVAAHDVLVEYFDGSEDNLDADLTASLDAVPDGSAKDRGMAIGGRAAADMIESREDDGRDDTSIVYNKAPRPGSGGRRPVAPCSRRGWGSWTHSCSLAWCESTARTRSTPPATPSTSKRSSAWAA